MTITTISRRLDLPNQALLFDLEALYGQLLKLGGPTRRDLYHGNENSKSKHSDQRAMIASNRLTISGEM